MCILIFSVPTSVSSYFPHYPLQHTVGCTYTTTLNNLDYFKYDLLIGRAMIVDNLICLVLLTT